uniref:Uncharacterized protein n=1 Tax=Chrysemys picta bellii TaxID=8478 RepID=A0A8C3P7M6_CHRPI
MTEVEPVLDFASSGRTGRRNALPDILGSPAGVSPSDLPLKLAEMSLSSGMYQTAGLALPDGTAGNDLQVVQGATQVLGGFNVCFSLQA